MREFEARVVSREAAAAWIDRWDTQQQAYMPDREERFTALIDAVADGAGRPDPLVLDLGCGPGSLGVRLLDRIPGATVVGVDADPLLLALAQAAWADRAGLRFTELDLRGAGWTGALGLDRPADAAVSTTALHWLPPEALVAMYGEVATVLRPGGLMLDGDHLTEDKAASPTLARLGRALAEREARRHPPAAGAETWAGWGEAATADPALAGPAARREALGPGPGHHGPPPGPLPGQAAAPPEAGIAR